MNPIQHLIDLRTRWLEAKREEQSAKSKTKALHWLGVAKMTDSYFRDVYQTLTEEQKDTYWNLIN